MRHLLTLLATAPRLLLAAALFSAAALSAAFIAQYGFGLYPCHLCLLQRYPYAAIIALALVARFLPPHQQRYVAMLCAGLFAIDAGIAFYHTGVEEGWFPGPSGCTNNAPAGQTLEDMRRALMDAPLVSCDQPMAYIFGLSLAAWNAVAATLATFSMIMGIRYARR